MHITIDQFMDLLMHWVVLCWLVTDASDGRVSGLYSVSARVRSVLPGTQGPWQGDQTRAVRTVCGNTAARRCCKLWFNFYCYYHYTTHPCHYYTHHYYTPATTTHTPLLHTRHYYTPSTATHPPLLHTHHYCTPTTTTHPPLLHPPLLHTRHYYTPATTTHPPLLHTRHYCTHHYYKEIKHAVSRLCWNAAACRSCGLNVYFSSVQNVQQNSSITLMTPLASQMCSRTEQWKPGGILNFFEASALPLPHISTSLMGSSGHQ